MPAATTPAPDAPKSSATVTAAPPSAQTSFLDVCLVLSGMAIIAFVIGCLVFVHNIPTASLPIIAGLAGTLLGTVIGGYAAYRWGASDAMKKLTATSTTAQ